MPVVRRRCEHLATRGERPVHPDVVVIEIETKTLEAYRNAWPFPRDQYALKPDRSLPVGRGVGLQLASGGATLGETTSRAWNVDVFTSWSFYRSLALYGRMGYAQSETTSLYGPLPAADVRRTRDGMNYGVGMRYDMNSALGLRLEYGRFGRFSTEFSGGLPETDQVTLGVQLRF